MLLNARQKRRLEAGLVIGLPDECWPWRGTMFSNGYGRFLLNGVECVAHRVVYELLRGEVPDGYVLDHLCRAPACVNPDHLEPVTQQINTHRGVGPTAKNAAKAQCAKGHEFTPENTRLRRGKRECRTCVREQLRDQWKRGARKRGANG